MTASPILSPVKFCKKCQCETARHKFGHCAPCTNARSAAWKKSNQEKVKATSAAWLAANAERVKSNRLAWLSANPEKAAATRADWLVTNRDISNAKSRANKKANPERERANYLAWVAKNPDAGRARSAEWRTANPDREKANHQAWRAANPDASKVHNQNRRALRINNGGVLSKGIAEKLFKLQRGKCACCSQPLGDNYHIDHIMPMALGGTNTDDNVQLLRQRCNNQKHTKHPVDFMQSRGFLL